MDQWIKLIVATAPLYGQRILLRVPCTQYHCDTYNSKMSKNIVVGLQSYGLFLIWTTPGESRDWCLSFSFFKYMQYVGGYQITCLSTHCKISYCILTPGNWGLFVKIPSFSHKWVLHPYGKNFLFLQQLCNIWIFTACSPCYARLFHQTGMNWRFQFKE